MKTLFILLSVYSLTAYAVGNEAALIIRDHRFEPEEVHVSVMQYEVDSICISQNTVYALY